MIVILTDQLSEYTISEYEWSSPLSYDEVLITFPNLFLLKIIVNVRIDKMTNLT